MHVDDKKRDILVLGKGPTQGLDNTAITAEAKYSINFTESGKRFVLSLNYNRSNSFLFVNALKMYQFKVKDSEIKPYPPRLGNISKDFTINDMKEKELKGYVHVFSVDYNIVNTNDILDIHKYFMNIT